MKPALALARPGKLIYRNAEYLSATLAVDESAMRKWLPPGVKLAKPARADLFCAYFPDNSFGAVYREAGLFVHIQIGKKIGIHCPWMLVDNGTALILGRELLGYPKKWGVLEWGRNGVALSARACRNGSELLRMQARLGSVISEPPPFLGRPHRNVIGSLGFSLPRLLAFTPKESNVETRQAEIEVSFNGSDSDPLDKMGLGR